MVNGTDTEHRICTCPPPHTQFRGRFIASQSCALLLCKMAGIVFTWSIAGKMRDNDEPIVPSKNPSTPKFLIKEMSPLLSYFLRQGLICSPQWPSTCGDLLPQSRECLGLQQCPATPGCCYILPRINMVLMSFTRRQPL